MRTALSFVLAAFGVHAPGNDHAEPAGESVSTMESAALLEDAEGEAEEDGHPDHVGVNCALALCPGLGGNQFQQQGSNSVG